MDRRIKKTKTAIKKYIIDAYTSNNQTRLSISKLCQDIDINRSTFYLHYSSIDAVMKELEDDALNIISENIKKYHDNYFLLVDGICSFIKSDPKLFKALFIGGGEHFISLINRRYYDLVSQSILVKRLKDGPSKDYVIIFIISGCIGVFKKWIDENFKTKEEEIIQAFLKFLSLDFVLLNN